MATLGEKLKQKREARGVSLQEIARATRIHVNSLQALEDDNYNDLPATVFITGFLRSYANHLGLDANSIVAEFEALKIEKPLEKSPKTIPDTDDSNLSVVAIISFLVLILIGYVLYINWPQQKVKTVTRQETARPAIKPPVDLEIPVETEETADVEVTEKETAKEVKAEKKTKTAKVVKKKEEKPAPVKTQSVEEKKKKTARTIYRHRLVVRAIKKDAWILVVVDDDRVRDLFVRAGQKIVLLGNKSFNFTTGNAAHIKITLDGKEVPVKVPPSNVISKWSIPIPGED